MSESYDWSQFRVHMYYRAPLERVFAAWATPAGMESFFIGTSAVTSTDGEPRGATDIVAPGDRYRWTWLHPFELDGTFTAVEKGQRVAFTFGGCQCDVTFREVEGSSGGAVEVALHQTSCATEDPERAWQHLNCRSCWIYFMLNLKSVLEQGVDLRDREDPAWNDSVSIGWTAAGASEAP